MMCALTTKLPICAHPVTERVISEEAVDAIAIGEADNVFVRMCEGNGTA